MAEYTTNYRLELPKSNEHYDVAVANKNNMVIDSELHKFELKNQSQDNLLATKESLNEHISNKNNPHNVTKSQVGLGNVDNTSDLNKPVSIAQQIAINESLIQADNYTDNKIAELINGAPETLDTLKEVADAIAENETIVEALDSAIGTKINQSNILKNIKSVNENTSEGKLVDALVVKEVFQSVSDGKQLVASAITDKGVETEATDTFEVMAENIKNISSEGLGNIKSPLIHNFYFHAVVDWTLTNFRSYFTIQKMKKLIIKDLYCTGSKDRETSDRNVSFRIYGKTKNGISKNIWSFIGTIDGIGVTKLISIENMEIDISDFESIEFFEIILPSATTDYKYGIDLQSCIFELYI